MTAHSENIKEYFHRLDDNTRKCLKIAQEARKKGYDPADDVEIKIANSMAERVVGLISVVAPQLAETDDAVKRIEELEKEFGAGDWRVAMKIAHEIATEKFCSFTDPVQAMEVGIRMGFAYVTVGVVSSPLEGLTHIDVKKRKDGKEYICLNYSGPIRNAGGTAAAVSVLISDYVRKKLGYDVYDPTETEVKRLYAEVMDYHDRITNLQYVPSRRELEYLCERLPVEIGGDPTEKIEVSNFKNLERIPTNNIRSGMCLILSSCIPLKAKKLWKQLSKWGHEMDMEQWDILEEFNNIQKEEKAKGGKKEEKDEEDTSKIKPDYTYISDLVAGRPVFGHPLREGGFRLRYGRSRFSGFSAQSIHPATMEILNQFIAIGTQCKTERPGKAGAYSSCDTIEGPIVKLHDGTVLRIDSMKTAKKVKNDVEKVLYNGDVLISYGDFFNRAHNLIPSGYCEEWWIQDFKKAVEGKGGSFDPEAIASKTDLDIEEIRAIFNEPMKTRPSFHTSFKLCRHYGVPLHPLYTLFWKSLKRDMLLNLADTVHTSKILKDDDENVQRIIIPYEKEKESLELLGLPHYVQNNEYIIIEKEWAAALYHSLGIGKTRFQEMIDFMEANQEASVIDIINHVSGIKINDKSGTFIGARLGRPEKAKHRKLQGSPHVLFPVGEEGGRLRCFQSALKSGKITADFPIFYSPHTGKYTIFSVCEETDKPTQKMYVTNKGYISEEEGNKIIEQNKGEDDRKKHIKISSYMRQDIDINHYFDLFLQKLGTKVYPDLIKGVKGTFSRDHIPEHLIKGILRAKYNVFVNKDGTIRYDCSELPVTHFKPKEIYVSVDKLREIGYTEDIYGKELADKNQILEIKPQDVIIPCCPDAHEEPSDKIVYRTGKFIDELLEKMYGLPPFYNFKTREDMVGTTIVGLAPHTSAGIISRIVGFSKSQAFLAHPMLHAAMRRDCDGDESSFFLLLDAFLNFSKKYLPTTRGSTMDAPLVITQEIIPAEVDDMLFDLDTAWNYPLEFYEAAQEYKMPWDVKIDTVNNFLGTERQYEGYGFTHDTSNYNSGVLCSAYKLLPSMEDKLRSQMELSEKIRAVDAPDVARLVIEKHFMKDLKGNLRKYSMQQFRCVHCNEKFRRPPIKGVCPYCNGKIIFTISQGSVGKYLEPSISLANNFHVEPYLNQSLELVKEQFESIFGKDKEIQAGLGSWFG
ncbi:MAG: DNA polymerase II large subunit [Candidatus Woesearchaeota archaeon]